VAGETLRLELAEDLDPLREEWGALAQRSGNVFAAWEWASAWWKHFGRGRALRVGVCRDADGRVVAIVPLYVAFRRPVRVARFLGHGVGDELGPVSERGDSRVADALRRSARELGWDVLLAERLPGDSGLSEALPGRTLNREASPVIAIEGKSWDDYLAERSKNFRSQLRRKERALVRDHGLSFRLADDPSRLERDMDALVALHEARWGEEGSGALSGDREAFHREFVVVALERGWLRLWMAELDGRPAAAWYGFRFGGADWYYQLGRDPSWDRASLGLVLLAHTVREAMADGQREYKLLRGAESYKDRFATGDPGLSTVGVGRGPVGRAVVAMAATGLALPGPLRRRLTRAVG
jgi:CelD/BcsL family acetyltransferase involved in cellulose biosynthesis